MGNYVYLCAELDSYVMAITFIGDPDCKVDAKGRIMLPVNFRRKLGEVEPYLFVIVKDMYKQCLQLYTMETWEEKVDLIEKKINPFEEDDMQVLRDFMMDSTEVECDPAGRILIPKRLLKQADINNDAILAGFKGRIEIWSPELYGKSVGDNTAKRERFARILGNPTSNT